MGGIAAHDEEVCSLSCQTVGRSQKFRHRTRSLTQYSRSAVWDCGVVIDENMDMFLVFMGCRRFDDFLHQVHSCHGPHTADDSYRFHNICSFFYTVGFRLLQNFISCY